MLDLPFDPLLNMFLTGFTGLLFGLCLGSFVTAISYRLPRGFSISTLPSHCPHCRTKLQIPDLIPVVSWFMAGGRCRHCGKPIGVRYPLTEGITAFFCTVIALQVGLGLTGIILALALTMLLAIIIIDFEMGEVPDSLLLCLLLLVMGLMGLMGGWLPGLLGAITFSGIAVLARWGARLWCGQAFIGWGHIKLAAIAGLWVGWPDLGWLVLGASAGSAILLLLWGPLQGRLYLPLSLAIGGGWVFAGLIPILAARIS
jgi:leader peptidase (prepilin peptidase) / N-methyltransferase